MATIKISKGTFKRVPEGKRTLYITDVKLVPSGKPQKVEFYYEDEESGATMKEMFSFTHPVSSAILGERCDILYNGQMAEGTEIDTADLPALFMGQIVTADIVHKEVQSDDGKTRTFVNIKHVDKYEKTEF